ncbi:MAG: hypothetical protein ACJ71P_09665 [Nitrososphaeraceae archaeon]
MMLDNDDKQNDEMIPFFSVASIDFDKDLIILKKYYINLSKEHIRKMRTNSVKEQH